MKGVCCKPRLAAAGPAPPSVAVQMHKPIHRGPAQDSSAFRLKTLPGLSRWRDRGGLAPPFPDRRLPVERILFFPGLENSAAPRLPGRRCFILWHSRTLVKGRRVQASMVEMPRVVSSSTSSSTRTVSREVNIVTPFSTAHSRISWPSDRAPALCTSRVLMT